VPSAQHWRVLTVPKTPENYASAAGHALQARSKPSHVLSNQVNSHEVSCASCRPIPGRRFLQWPHKGGSIQVAAGRKNRHCLHIPFTIAARSHQTRRKA